MGSTQSSKTNAQEIGQLQVLVGKPSYFQNEIITGKVQINIQNAGTYEQKGEIIVLFQTYEKLHIDSKLVSESSKQYDIAKIPVLVKQGVAQEFSFSYALHPRNAKDYRHSQQFYPKNPPHGNSKQVEIISQSMVVAYLEIKSNSYDHLSCISVPKLLQNYQDAEARLSFVRSVVFDEDHLVALSVQSHSKYFLLGRPQDVFIEIDNTRSRHYVSQIICSIIQIINYEEKGKSVREEMIADKQSLDDIIESGTKKKMTVNISLPLQKLPSFQGNSFQVEYWMEISAQCTYLNCFCLSSNQNMCVKEEIRAYQ